MRLLPLLPFLAALAGCATPRDNFDFETCGVRPRLAIPVEMQGNIPLMRATVKGVPATFVLDTGAVSVVLTEPALRRFGLGTDARTINVVSGVGGTARTFAGHLEDFRIGDLDVPDHKVSVLPPTAGISTTGIDGLFGVSVLSIFEIELDLPRRLVTLYAGRLCPDTLAPPWVAQARVLDASRSERGRFIVPIVLDGKVLTALLDTGASRTVVATDVALALGITPETLARDPQATMSGAGPQTAAAAIHRFGEINVAGQRFANPTLYVSTRAEPGLDMILGADYLANRRLWLSYARRRVFIENAPAP